MDDLESLPGAELVRRGLEDLSRKTLSAEALTLSIASTRLRRLGIELPEAGRSRTIASSRSTRCSAQTARTIRTSGSTP